MPTVTYKNQPAIHATRGAVPLAGTSHLYRVHKVLWPSSVWGYIETLLLGTTLHVCSGKSHLGDVRLDLDPEVSPDLRGDAARLPFPDGAFSTVLCDPPYNGKFRWNHDLLAELSRIAASRIVFQHWYLVANAEGRYKKRHAFKLTELNVWSPRTYFGRAQLVQVFDRDLDLPEQLTLEIGGHNDPTS